MTIDPADLNILSETMRSIATEMGDVMCRSAHSSIVREARDCAACIADAQGRMVAQPEMNAIHLNSIAAVFDYARDMIDLASLSPEEALITNNPFHLGQHLNDIFLMLPVFHEGVLVAFSGSICHHLELGGMIAGSAADATEIFHEGLILPMMRINLKKDLYGGPIEKMIAANVRLPEVILGDFHAQLAATIRGRSLIEKMFERYGSRLMTTAMAEIQAYSERVMRSKIRSIPNGTYIGEEICDGRQLRDPVLGIRVKLTIAGDEALVDLRETDDEVRWPINSPRASTLSAAYTVFSAIPGGVRAPTNDGTYRPIKVITREGSLVDPRHPAPVRSRMVTTSRVAGALRRALVDALPDLVPASGNDSTNMVSLSRRTTHGYEMFTETLAGGTGAGLHCDGESVVAQMLSNSSNTPVESIEIDHPFVRIVEYRQSVDSAGAGKHRGGLGQRRVYEILDDNVLVSTSGDRHASAPLGAAGGGAGVCSRYVVQRGNEMIRLPAVATAMLMKGDRFIVELTGGGGFGAPKERARSAVLDDLDSGRISAVAAVETYGLSPAELKASARQSTTSPS